MAIIEQDALIRVKDAQKNSYLIYPITKAENVDGLTEALAPLASSESVNNAKSEAISTAAADATSKVNQAVTDSKTYTNSEVAKDRSRLSALETASATHALASDVTALASRVTTAEGEIDTLQSDLDTKANSGHNHDSRYYTESEIDSKLSGKSDVGHTHSQYVNQNAFSKVAVGSTTIEADNTTDTLTLAAGSNVTLTPDASGDKVTITAKDTVYTHPNSGVTAGTYKSVTVNAQGHVTAGTNPTTLAGYGITDAETKGAAATALSQAKTYADSAAATAANNVKNDLLNGAGAAYDTLKELGDLIDTNTDAIDALEAVAAGKANATHSHAISDVTGLQTALNGKAATSHGTHVSYSTTAPVMDGTASVGTATTVARSDHKHPTDTSRAAKTDLDSHTSNTTVHITSTERTNWNAAKTHADSAHAPSNAQANQNAFSYVKVGDTSVAADSATDTLTLAGSNVTITPDATNDKITFTVANGSTSSKGVVQLTNSTSSTSTTTAATPNSVKSAYDLANTAKTAAAAAQTTADGKANASHTHKVANITDLTATATELNYMDGVTSNVQTQLDGKSSTSHTHNLSTMINTLSAGTSTPTDADYYVCQYAGGGTTTTTYHRRPLSALWSWIKSKADSVYQAKGSYASSSHTHDDRYYTESEIDTKVSTINTAISGKAASSHTHTIANVTNLQSSLDAKQATVTGGASTITSSNLTTNRALVSNSSGKVAVSAITSTELGYLDGVTSNVQTQLDGKAASSHNHSASNITSGTLSSDRLPTVPIAKGGTGATTAAAALTNLGITATATELNYVDGVTSNIQTQLNGKSSTSHTHSYAGSSSVGGAATSANKLNTNAGDANTPVYFSNGVPVACTSLDLNTTGSAASCTGNSATATKLQTARTISLSTGVTGTATSFNGTANISIPVTDVKEAYLSWGGKALSDSVSPIDVASSDIHSANRFAFAKAAGITIEYSTDGGSTYSTYSTTDSAKINLVSGIGSGYYIGARSSSTTVNDKLRITLNATNMGLYTRLRKLLINITTNYATGSNVIVEKAMKGSESTYTTVGTYSISGWSGWNSIPINAAFGGGNTKTYNIANLRLTFGITGVNSSQTANALTIMDIIGIGDTYWSYPSNMAKNGHLYTYDASQNATFPAKVTASSFSGSLSGNATTATTATKLGSATVGGTAKPIYLNGGTATACSSTVGSATQPVYMNGGTITACTYTLGKSVPSNAVFTDTTYSAATTSAAGLMSASDKSKLNGIASGANAYTLPAATSSTLGGVKTGSNITNSSGTISLTKANVTAALGYYNVEASGDYSHAEGYYTKALGESSHAEGDETYTEGDASHAEGFGTQACGYGSHAEGYETYTEGDASHAEGFGTEAFGYGSHAEGGETLANGYFSHAEGLSTIANDYQHASGKFNVSKTGPSRQDTQDSTQADAIFLVGCGTSSARKNAFRISSGGKCYGTAAFGASGADFAELFEWADGNPDSEDRRGLFVTLDGEKIKLANAGDDYIGVISSAQAFVGNSASEDWQGKYLTDVFGAKLSQEVEVPAEIDEETGEVITPATTTTQYVLNPDYDPDQEYVMRENRKEWGIVGLLGQIVVVDDGTCVVGGRIEPSTNGIGTASTSGYRVMARIDENHVKILVK